MAKLQWISVQPSGACPGQRWGHSCCVVQDSLYLFGGFANATYMNDLWVYNLKQAKWRQIVTCGDVPDQRSNATLNYDSVNHQLVLFGGGGPNKQRFNCVSVLDLNSLCWVEFQPFENEPSPWERTYHTAEFKYPYLVIFGGQGVDDLGDLWAYNLQTLSWKQIKFNANAVRPQARRFHSSCMADNSLYLFGGCEGKYVCLGDFYKLDLTTLFETGTTEQLSWVKIKLSDQVVARWGHTSYYYNGHVYVFGGRAVDDLKDLFTINVNSGKVTHLQTKQQPKARRRHSGGFMGSCLVLFGGFDGSYFNDLFYLNLYENVSKQKNERQLTFDYEIETVSKQTFGINTVLLSRYFNSKEDMVDFLNQIQRYYLKEELEVIFRTLYRGYGQLPLQNCHKKMLGNLPFIQQITNHDYVYSVLNTTYRSIVPEQKLAVQLDPIQLNTYIKATKQHWLYNHSILLNRSQSVKVNKELLALESQFFKNFFSHHYHNERDMEISLKFCKAMHFELLVCYAHTGILVLPKHSSHHFLAQMVHLAQYFNMSALLQICQQQLIYLATIDNYRQLLQIGLHYELQKLTERCCLLQIDQLLSKEEALKVLSEEKEKGLDKRAQRIYKLIQFDLAHQRERFVKNPTQALGSSVFSNKENMPTNNLSHKASGSFQK